MLDVRKDMRSLELMVVLWVSEKKLSRYSSFGGSPSSQEAISFGTGRSSQASDKCKNFCFHCLKCFVCTFIACSKVYLPTLLLNTHHFQETSL